MCFICSPTHIKTIFNFVLLFCSEDCSVFAVAVIIQSFKLCSGLQALAEHKLHLSQSPAQ